MSHLKSINQARTARAFIGWAVRHGAGTRQNGTSHVVITTPRGLTVVCQHSGEIPRQVRSKIVKTFAALGLAALAVALIVIGA